MTKKPRVAVVAIQGKRLARPIEARVSHGKICGYCDDEDFRVMYVWNDRQIGNVTLTYGAGCDRCCTLEGE